MSYEWYSGRSLYATSTSDRTTYADWSYPPSHTWYEYHPEDSWFEPRIMPKPLIRYPKSTKGKWKKYVSPKDRIEDSRVGREIAKLVEVRPVLVCGWCGARIARGKEDEPCEYCGS